MITILSFFAKGENSNEMTTVSTDLKNYKYTRVENGQVVEEKITTAITIVTAYYQIDLLNAIENNKKIIFL